MELYCEEIGTGEPTLLLVHGLAANGAVWEPAVRIMRDLWPGTILVPDLRGHGRSPHGRHYGYGQHAADLADLIAPGKPVFIIGHSMGAVVGLALANGWYGTAVEAVFGFGVKVDWTEAEMEKAHALSKVPVRWFETRSEAVERFLRFSGLTGLADGRSAAVEAGLRQETGRWRLASDPRIFSVPGPPFREIFRLAKTRCALACGSEDAMVRIEELRAFDPHAVRLGGLGHNLHMQAPESVVEASRGVLPWRLPEYSG
jgi:pimeloyl-ACP methyl ester carboxylesterase